MCFLYVVCVPFFEFILQTLFILFILCVVVPGQKKTEIERSWWGRENKKKTYFYIKKNTNTPALLFSSSFHLAVSSLWGVLKGIDKQQCLPPVLGVLENESEVCKRGKLIRTQ